MAASASALSAGLTPPLEALGVDLEDVQVQRAGRREVVRVVIDRDGGVDLDLVAQVSQRVAELLDAAPLADQFAGAYVLEVSSPGVDRPLREPRHWRRAMRRRVIATLADGSTVEGRVVDVSDDGVQFDVGTESPRTVPFAELVSGAVQVEFNRVEETEADGPDAEPREADEAEEQA